MVSLRRVDAIRRTTEAIMAGNLGRRIPTRGTQDEFDRLAGQVNLMLDRIQSLMSGLQQVSNDIAHDLKTPLSRMRQHLEMARYRATTIPDYQTAVDQAIGQCDRALQTFDALLRIAQIEAGTRRAGFRPFDLSTVAETMVDLYQPLAEESEHRLTAEIAAGVPLLGDQELVGQMIANLMENAFKHTPSGTPVHLSLAVIGGHPVLRVEDGGPGIPVAERDKVLQRFYRLDASRSVGGNGLGLSLVAAVAQLHDARLTLSDNAPGLCVEVAFADQARPPE
jgi:signal transduction histidine kinase